MSGLDHPGRTAVTEKGWLAAHRWLLARRLSQLAVIGVFLSGPWFGLWIAKGNLASSLTLGVLPLIMPPFVGAVALQLIFGRSGTVGYVQRLAVAPLHRAQGVGRGLMLDGLAWLARRRVQTVFVNTQHDNTIALALYESLGFRRQPTGLQILALPLGGGSAGT